MSLPYEEARALVAAERLLERLLDARGIPGAIRGEAGDILRHMPGATQLARWEKLTAPVPATVLASDLEALAAKWEIPDPDFDGGFKGGMVYCAAELRALMRGGA